MKDDLGDRMKSYERGFTEGRVDPTLPFYVRIDGRGFSKLTKEMDRPFDLKMMQAMIETTVHLVTGMHATIGYTQSDEISLAFVPGTGPSTQYPFDGKIQKLTSVLAGMASSRFTVAFRELFPGRTEFPHFDCRAFTVPSTIELGNAFLWRYIDCRKNAVSMLARTKFSHRELHRVGTAEMIKKLQSIGIDFLECNPAFRLGTFVRQVAVERRLTDDELQRIPESVRPSPDLLVKRNHTELTNINFAKVFNRAEFVSGTEDPRW